MKIIEMATNDLEYYRNLVDKATAGFERIDFNFEKSSVDKMLLKSIVFYRKIVQERITGFANFIVVIFYDIALVIPTFSGHHPVCQKQTSLSRKNPSPAKGL